MTPAVKMAILGHYLDFVALYIDLKDAIVATLGGTGYELRIWQERGIEKKHGWMVERGRKIRLDLLEKFPYQLCTSLSALPTSIRAVSNPPRLDAFHLDLCGTLEPSVEDFSKVLELVGRSEGRCFAITVCEERRNIDLENEKLEVQLMGILGTTLFRRFREQVASEQQQFGGEKGLRREMGVLLHLIELFERQKRFSVPDRIERIIYRSDMVPEKAFWMRTYLFHLGHGVVPKQERAQKLVSVWTAQPLREYRDEQFLEVELPVGERIMSQYKKLQVVAEAIGGEVLADFQLLLQRAQRVDALDEALPALKKLLGNGFVAGYDPPANTDTVLPRRNSLKRKKEVTENGDEEGGQTMYVRPSKTATRVALLESLATGKEGLESRNVKIARRAGIKTNRKDWRRKLGSLLAWATGSHQQSFVQQAKDELGEEVVAKLAEYYSKISGKTVTVNDLLPAD